jgi:aminopeptidase N
LLTETYKLKLFLAYPSSHPVVKPIYFFYDIEQLFDDVESSKVAAILRMVEYEIGSDEMWNVIGVRIKICFKKPKNHFYLI